VTAVSYKAERCRSGFTVLELLIAIAIIGILTVMIFPSLATVRERAEKVICISHLRSLHISLGCYLNDRDIWPQGSYSLVGDEAAKFWTDALKDYGGGDIKTWQCPTLRRRLTGKGSDDPNVPKIHYTPTLFDDKPMSPRSWPKQPWLIEIGDMHHSGNLIIFTDGHVGSLRDFISFF